MFLCNSGLGHPCSRETTAPTPDATIKIPTHRSMQAIQTATYAGAIDNSSSKHNRTAKFELQRKIPITPFRKKDHKESLIGDCLYNLAIFCKDK